MAETKTITKELIENAYTYKEYKDLIERLISEKKTTGPKQSEKLFLYTKNNFDKMLRVESGIKIHNDLANELKDFNKKIIWLVLTEAWCTDTANTNPIFAAIAELCNNINLRFILRDENFDVMDAYLTNGTRSIPKLICLDAKDLTGLGSWGPRPKDLQNLVKEIKNNPEYDLNNLIEQVNNWYKNDESQSTQRELLELIKLWKNF